MRDTATAAVQEALLGRATASAGVGVLVSDDTLRYVAANSTACKLLGYARDQLLALRVPDVFEQSEGDLLEAAREVADGKIRHGTVNVRRRDGRSFPVQYVSAAATLDRLPFVLTVLW